MKVRMIEEKDIQTILNWYNEYILETAITFETEPLSLIDFTSRVRTIRKSYPWLVLEDENTLLGYAYLSCFHERKAYAYTADVSIYLNPKEKGKGYGSILLNALISLAMQDGYHKLISVITSDNLNSIAFHQRHGFHTIGTIENAGYKFNRWYGVTYMEKEINSVYPANEAEIQNLDWKENL